MTPLGETLPLPSALPVFGTALVGMAFGLPGRVKFGFAGVVRFGLFGEVRFGLPGGVKLGLFGEVRFGLPGGVKLGLFGDVKFGLLGGVKLGLVGVGEFGATVPPVRTPAPAPAVPGAAVKLYPVKTAAALNSTNVFFNI